MKNNDTSVTHDANVTGSKVLVDDVNVTTVNSEPRKTAKTGKHEATNPFGLCSKHSGSMYSTCHCQA